MILNLFRVFSTAGNVLTKKRNRLGGEDGKVANMIITMNSNKKSRTK